MALENNSSSILVQAEQLERLSIKYIQDKNRGALEKMLDPACQFVSAQGVCDRAQAMTLMKQMNLGPVAFKDFKVSQAGDNVIVSFWLSATEDRSGKTLSPCFSPRLSIWRGVDEQYLCIAYADFITA